MLDRRMRYLSYFETLTCLSVLEIEGWSSMRSQLFKKLLRNWKSLISYTQNDNFDLPSTPPAPTKVCRPTH